MSCKTCAVHTELYTKSGEKRTERTDRRQRANGRDPTSWIHSGNEWPDSKCLYFFVQICVNVTGSDAGMPSFGRGDDNGMPDDRIAHILTEASNMMKPTLAGQQSQQPLVQQPQQHLDDSHSNDDSDSPHNQCPSPFSKDGRRSRKYDNDDISHDKVARIYQEELAKLMSRAPRDAFPRYVLIPSHFMHTHLSPF